MKLLLADTDFQFCEMVTRRLEQESFVVETCANGEEALRLAQSSRYDVIVIDLLLPGKNGFEVVCALRSLGDKTPILMTSPRSSVEDRVQGLNLGADDYLMKHFCLAEFIARIKSILRRKSTMASNIIRSGDLVVNLSNMLITRRGQPIRLTRKEAGILIELIRHKGKIISRQDLLDSVWGNALDLEYSNTLDVHIRTLRQKVDQPYETKMIQTVRGYGYMVE